MFQRDRFVRAARLIWIPTALLIAIPLCDLVSIAYLPHRAMGMGRTGTHITSVVTGSGFWRAGIRSGDRLNDDSETRRLFRDESFVDYAGPYRVVVHRGRATFRTSVDTTIIDGTTFVGGPIGYWGQVGATIAFIATIVVSAWLFAVRPTWMTFALFLSTTSPPFADGFVLQVLPPILRVVAWFSLSFIDGAAPWFFVIFALRFPNEQKAYWRRSTEVGTLILALVSAALSVGSSYVGFQGVWAELASVTLAWLSVISYLLAIAILFTKIVRSQGAAMARLRWAILGVSIPLTVESAFLLASAVGYNLGYWLVIPALSTIPLYLSLAYVLTRSRFVDPRFSVNRAALWSVTAAVLVAGVAGIDWITSRLLEQRRLSDAIDAAVAIALGFCLNAFHHRIESALERIVFRAKHRASRRIRAIGSAVSFATADSVIESATVSEAAVELRLTSAALFQRDTHAASEFRRITSVGWSALEITAIDENEKLVRLLRSERSALSLRDWPLGHGQYPGGIAAPRVAIPIFTREELRAFVLYGAHQDHTELDSSEIELLCWLAEKCSAAMDHIEVRSLRALMRINDERTLEPARTS